MDVYQLPPVAQDHDSKFFNKIDSMLTEPMRFTGPIANLAPVYKNAIKDINDGFSGNKFALNEGTSRQDSWDDSLDSGYRFKNSIHPLIEQVSDEIKLNPDNINFSRMIAFKNDTVSVLNRAIRDNIYGTVKDQFEYNEIVISNGGFTVKDIPIIYNGEILKVEGVKEIVGPYDVPCLSLKFQGFSKDDHVIIPVIQNNPKALKIYADIKAKLRAYALQDRRQWGNFYRFIDSFAYFDYGYSVTSYKVQGQTLNNVYVFEGEVMNVKPLTLKQKYQALYVSMTRATKALYIYNKDY